MIRSRTAAVGSSPLAPGFQIEIAQGGGGGHRIGAGNGRLEVAGIEDQAVELLAEQRHDAEHAAMGGDVGRARIGQVNLPWTPGRSHRAAG